MLWVNIFAAAALFIQNQYGYVLPPTVETAFLLLVNVALRFITKSELTV